MSTTDGTGQDEPRYGRRLPEGQRPPAYEQQSSGQPGSAGEPGPGERDASRPWSSGAPGSGQHGGYGSGGYPQQPGAQGGYGQQPGGQPPGPGSYPPPGGYGQPSPYGQPGGGQTGGGYGPGGYGQQYGGYGPGGYGPPSGPPPKRTGAVIAIVVGALLMLGAPIGGFVIAIASATGSIGEIATDGAQLTNGGSLSLPANVERMVIFEASSIEPGTVSCDVTDPGGRSLPVSDTTEAFGAEDVPLPGVTFQTTSAGSYTITCDLPSDVNQSLIVTPPLDFGSLVSSGVTILIGLALGFLGLIVLIVGIVWLVRVNKRIRTGQY